ncbi:hypothetical protein KAR34_12385 [bacterium]|nr:hypothetical protein [bacterium]
MEITKILYYLACAFLWSGLMSLVVMAWRPGFPEWLTAHPKVMVLLLGTDQLPRRPVLTLRRFYLFLTCGFTWLLVWSWWLMPVIKDFFFRSTPTPTAWQVARISSIIVVLGYAAVGFYGIGKAITIWFKEIYSPTVKDEIAKNQGKESRKKN